MRNAAMLRWLSLPGAEEIPDLDDPRATAFHARLIREKGFLRRLYEDFYREFCREMNGISRGTAVELGSGGGFLKSFLPGVITSDVRFVPGHDLCFGVERMPFQDDSVEAFLMLNVLHHLKAPLLSLAEMNRCLKEGGKIVMIEPANTPWGRFIYRNFHHEDFDPSGGWTVKGEGTLSAANGALPWILFRRDRERFRKEFPSLRIEKIKCHTPFRYLASGGLSTRQLLPSFAYPVVKGIEFLLAPWNTVLGMFMSVVLVKKP